MYMHIDDFFFIDKNMLLTTSRDNTLKLIDIRTFETVMSLS